MMQSFSFVTAFLAIALTTSVSAEQEYKHGFPVVYNYQSGVDKCPAKFFWDDCNHCVCSNDGTTAACTLMACPELNAKALKDVKPSEYNYKPGDKCPAKFFKNDCNYCRCLDDGYTAACTLMECSKRDVDVNVIESKEVKDFPRVSDFKPGEKCPAKVFYLSCNLCVCTRDGKNALCTLMACPEDQ